MGADWATIDLDSSTLTIDLKSARNIFKADKVVIAKVVSTLTKDGVIDQDSVNITQAELQFAIKFETEVREEPTPKDDATTSSD